MATLAVPDLAAPAPADPAIERLLAEGSYLQSAAWARVKAANGWTSRLVVADAPGGPIAGRILIARRRALPWGFGYAPRGPIATVPSPRAFAAWSEAVRHELRGERLALVRIDPEIEAAGPDDPAGALRAALVASGWRRAPHVQPETTRRIDLSIGEAALWADLRPKWRQYVNRARSAGITVSEETADGLADFYRVYEQTASRAGFLIRTPGTYRDIRDAFAPSGAVSLLIARDPEGAPLAALFLVRAGAVVVEPYGGMTAAGAESRANYLVKWEAIRRAAAAGARTYDLWGLATSGIAHFKAGFGGREVRWIGAWDLELSAAGAGAYRVGAGALAALLRARRGGVGERGV